MAAGSQGFVAAIDQGTTGTTAVVVGEDGRVAGRGYRELTQSFPRPGWVEHDPQQLVSSSVEALGAAIDDAGVRRTDIRCLGLTNQRETTVCWDRETREPVAPAIVWQDRRTAGVARALASDVGIDRVRSRTGLVPDAYFAGTKMRWLLDHVDGLPERAVAGEVVFGTVDSWLLARLTAQHVVVTDVTNASRTLLMDLTSLAWDDELMAALGVPAAALPTIVASGGVIGQSDPTVLDGLDVPVAGVLGDQQAALFAQACFEPGLVKTTYGTGAFALMNTGGSPFTRQRSLLATAAVQLEGSPAEYALEGSVFTAGAAVQWLRDQLGIVDDAAATEAMAASVESTDDVWLVPAFTGLGAPYWDPAARGTVLGLSRGSSAAHLVRATLESITYQVADVVAAVGEESGEQVVEVRADGGAAANGWLMQFQADILGVPVDVPESLETTSLGSAYLAGLVTGVWSDRDELQRRRRTARRFEPAMSDDERSTRLERWHQAVERARDWARPDA